MYKRIILLAVLLMLSKYLCAEEPVEVIFGGLSYHTYSKDTTTWFHRALFVQKGDYLGGYARNSYGNDSFFAGYRLWNLTNSYITTEVTIGAVRGYDKCYGSFSDVERESGKNKVEACPLLLISVTAETGTDIKPQVSLWGDALVLTAKYTF